MPPGKDILAVAQMSLKHIEIAAEVKVMISYIALTKATITS